jgi:hypothetical protein
MVAFNGKLYVAFKSDDANNGVWMGGNSSPALAVVLMFSTTSMGPMILAMR